MCCSSVPPASARPRWRRSWRANSASASAPPPGPVIAKAGDLAALLTNLEERDVLFIDEIHRLSPAVEEVLYPAMEDFQLDLIIGEGPAARSVKIELAKFTLVGATTRAGLLTNPLRDRFGIPVRLNFYTEEELERIVTRGARVLDIGMTADGANEIARRARGTPRIAGRLLRRVRDFASAADAASIDRAIADHALQALEVDAAGLDAMDRRYLTTIATNYGGGPVGVETMAAALSEPRDAIEDIIEPFLIQCGYLQRTPRGRLLTSHAFRHLGLAEPARDPAQFGLFGPGRMSRDVAKLRYFNHGVFPTPSRIYSLSLHRGSSIGLAILGPEPMRITVHTDYALRLLMYLALKKDRLATIAEIAATYDISRNHLTKVAYRLGVAGYIVSIRGRGGGIRLAKPAEAIILGEVVRKTEPDMALVECMRRGGASCALLPACVVRRAMMRAGTAFLDVLDSYTLGDLIQQGAA